VNNGVTVFVATAGSGIGRVSEVSRHPQVDDQGRLCGPEGKNDRLAQPSDVGDRRTDNRRQRTATPVVEVSSGQARANDRPT
jgi:hypothetical protein